MLEDRWHDHIWYWWHSRIECRFIYPVSRWLTNNKPEFRVNDIVEDCNYRPRKVVRVDKIAIGPTYEYDYALVDPETSVGSCSGYHCGLVKWEERQKDDG